MTIGVIAAHPDDEVLGCGGTIPRLVGEHSVHIVILGEGISSRYEDRRDVKDSDLEGIRTDSRAAGALLGVKSIDFIGLPDNRFDELPLLDVIRRVEGWLERLKPEILYTHHPGDLNIDHAITFRAVLTATRPKRNRSVREVYAFEIPSSTEWAFWRFGSDFHPNVFVDVSRCIETKIQALQKYSSEVRTFPHPRSPEGLRAVAQRWGTVVGVEYAEAFELIWSVR